MSFPDSVTSDDFVEERKKLYIDFIASYAEYNYKDEILRLLRADEARLIINIDDLRDYNRELADGLLKSPFDWVPAIEKAFTHFRDSLGEPEKHDLSKHYQVGLSGSFGDHHVSPRTLQATHLNKMISLEGIITRCSLVRPKMVRSVHYTPKTNQAWSRDYRDATSEISNQLPTTSVVPVHDDDENPMQMEYGHCIFRDHQRISIQEMPERAPAGQLPRSTDVILDGDLVDRCKPGDRVQLVGVYRNVGGGSNGSFKSLILANNVILLSSKIGGGIAQTPLTDTDIRTINQMAKQSNIFDLLSISLAPSIYGHEYIKRAILLLLLGGAERNLANGTHIRGDINMLMVGDPSTAKSQLLRFILGTAPLAIATTGRGSSGVGLTAAVTTDKDTGERRLEAGAMVLADRGVVCIDEFDKMSDVDRVAIHEVMEQQTVTIAKAGIHTSLNARCSVVAAANPIYGQYDIHKDPHKNIALPDSLLSRFDLLFVVTDDVDEKRDRLIADHVLRMHRYLAPGVEEGTPVQDNHSQALAIDGPGANSQEAEAVDSSPFQKFDPLLHMGVAEIVGRRTRSKSKTKPTELLTITFIKKFIQYAKSKPAPALTQGAADHIIQVYATLRNEDTEGNQKRTSPLTARTLETLIRLSTAHAKARLSPKVEEKDAIEAERIMRYALFKEVPKRQRKKKHKPVPGRSGAGGTGADDDSEDGSSDESGDQKGPERMEAPVQQQGPPASGAPRDPIWGDESQDTQMDIQMDTQMEDITAGGPPGFADGGEIQPNRLALFRSRVADSFRNQFRDEEQFMLSDLLEHVNQGLPKDQLFGMAEARTACLAMQNADQLMLSDDIVYKV